MALSFISKEMKIEMAKNLLPMMNEPETWETPLADCSNKNGHSWNIGYDISHAFGTYEVAIVCTHCNLAFGFV